MKKGILYILLLSYSILMLKPVLPYIVDTLAHAFWYSKHMATVHYVDGEFHVHKAVVEEAKKAGPEQSPFSVKKEQSPNDHLISFIIPLTFKKVLLNVYFNRLSIPLIPADLETDFPPPKVVG